jgi:nicotinate phosphoribosyltransferase
MKTPARNLTLMTDLYQLTMIDAYIKSGKENQLAVFDFFFRNKEEFNYALFAGLEQAVTYIKNLKFSDDDIGYLKSLNLFSEKTLDYLKNFCFDGDIYSVPEGTVVFPGEPILVVKAKIAQAQLVETALLNILNHQTLIATKASRIVGAARGKAMEFGLRRAQGPDAGIYGARAAYIGGCFSTSNVLAGKLFGIPVSGTHAHSYIMSFPDELTAFRAYAKANPNSCLLLVDTYDTLRSGVKNAITVFKELKEQGYKPVGIRLDSGDLAYLSKVARKMLDEAGFPDAIICASGDLDEYSIQSLMSQGARIDLWGVGTRLITSEKTPSLGGIYKLVAVEEDGRLAPKIKISDNMVKITNPGFKTIYRLYDKGNMAIADLICLHDEEIDTTKPLTIFHPIETWKKMTLTDFKAKKLHLKIFDKGNLVYTSPAIQQIAEYAKEDLATFWSEYKRIDNPHIYKVDLSDKLYNLKQKLLKANGG